MPLKNASALDVVALLNRLLADPARRGGAPADVQQRVTIIADSRSNSILVRADNPGRLARVRQLIEQLDTPGRPGGNMFIVYLKNAEAGARRADAARDVERRRRRRRGSAARRCRRRRLCSSATRRWPARCPRQPMAPPPLASAPAPSTTSFSANGATITADLASNALIVMAPEPVYNNLRAIIEKLDVRRAQVFVEALIVEVSADKAAEFGIQWQALHGLQLDADARDRRHQLHAARQRQQHHRRRRQSGHRRPGSGARRDEGHGHDPGPRDDHEPGVSRPRARDADRRQHPVDADAAHARQRRSPDHRRPEHSAHHRQLRDDGRHDHRDAVPDVRAQGRRHRPSRQAADHRRRHDPPCASTRKCRASRT